MNGDELRIYKETLLDGLEVLHLNHLRDWHNEYLSEGSWCLKMNHNCLLQNHPIFLSTVILFHLIRIKHNFSSCYSIVEEDNKLT